MIRGASARLRAVDPLLLLLRCSLLVVLINSNDDAPQLVAVAVIAVIALPRERWLRSAWFWAALFVAIGLRQLATWHLIDDHIVVTTYWTGALALGLGATDQRRTLALASRLIIGSMFAIAAAWKLGSGEFADGTFFRYAFGFDERFHTVAHLAGGISGTDRRSNLADVAALRGQLGGSTIVVREGPRTAAVAWLFTSWGILVESALAVAFLAPLRPRWEWIRHGALAAFAITTYLVVPVAGFGCLLALLGSAGATDDRVRVAYVWGAIVLLAWSLVWPVVLG